MNKATDQDYGEYLSTLPGDPRELPAEDHLAAFAGEEFVPCSVFPEFCNLICVNGKFCEVSLAYFCDGTSYQGLPMEDLAMATSSTKLRWRGPVETKANTDPGLEKDMKLMELAFRMGQNAIAGVSPRTPVSSASSCGAAPQFPALPPPPDVPALQESGVGTIYVSSSAGC